MRSHSRTALSLTAVLALTGALAACGGQEPEQEQEQEQEQGAATETSAAPTTETASEAPEGEDADVLSLAVGDCLSDAGLEGEQVSTATTFDCADPHDAEVFAAYTHEDEEFPGVEAVQAAAEEYCTGEAFESFVGLDYDTSEYYVSSLTPTEQSWEQAGDRESLCLILSEEPVTGSLEGVNR